MPSNKLFRPELSSQSLKEGSLSNLQSSVVRVSEDLAFASINTDKYGIVLSKRDASQFTPEEIEKLNAAVAAVDTYDVEIKIDKLNSENGSIAGPYAGEIDKGLKEIVQARLEAVVNAGVQNLRIAGLSFAGTSLLDTRDKFIEFKNLQDECHNTIDSRKYGELVNRRDTVDKELAVLSWRVLEAVNLAAKYNAILAGQKSYPMRFKTHFSEVDGIYIEEDDPVKETPIED